LPTSLRSKVSIIWLTYNSNSLISEAKESLNGIANLRHSNFELVVVDNGSDDRSVDVIWSAVRGLGIKSRLVSTGRNLGFAGGNNRGLAEVAPDSEYVVLLNSDYVPFEDSLNNLVRNMERSPKVGLACPIELNWSGKKIANAGHFLDELLNLYPRHHARDVVDIPDSRVTYAAGSYCIVRREILDRLGRIFDANVFFGWEDTLLSLEVWNLGYEVWCFGEIGGKHYGSLTSSRQSSPMGTSMLHGGAYFLGATNSRFKDVLKVAKYESALRFAMIRNDRKWIDAFANGFKMGVTRQPYLDLYKAPIIRCGIAQVTSQFFFGPIVQPMQILTSKHL
jgi:GT2 family glycosyltransferase